MQMVCYMITFLYYYLYYLAIQFAGASKRMSETYDAIIKHVYETHSGDFIGYVMILYAH